MRPNFHARKIVHFRLPDLLAVEPAFHVFRFVLNVDGEGSDKLCCAHRFLLWRGFEKQTCFKLGCEVVVLMLTGMV